jgi:hypothetical protein
MAEIKITFLVRAIDELNPRQQRLLSLWADMAHQELVRYLNQFRIRQREASASLEVVVERFHCEASFFSFDREVVLVVRGRVNDKRIRFQVHKVLNSEGPGSTFTGSLQDFAVTEKLRAFIANKQPDAEIDAAQLARDPYFAHLILAIFDGIDRASGRLESSISWQWRTSLCISAFCTFAAAAVIALLMEGSIGQKLLAGVMLGAPVLLLSYCVSASLMPLEFFNNYAAGRRVKLFVARNEAREARRVLRIAVLALIGLALFFIFTVYNTFAG